MPMRMCGLKTSKETPMNASTHTANNYPTGALARQPAENATAAIGAQQRRAVGRFKEQPGMAHVRRGFRLLSRFAPGLAAQMGYALLSTPPRTPERPWQAALREQATLTRLMFGAGHLAVYAWGKGPVVLMVNGWGARAAHMGKMVQPLVQAGMRVVAFNPPATGLSSGKRLDLVRFSAAVHAVAAHVGPLHGLVAHSFGCPIALMAMRDWGTQARRLVMISSINDLRWFTDAFVHYTGISPAVMERMKQMMVDRNNGGFDWSKSSVTEMLRRAALPTLLIHDLADAEVPFEHSLALLKAGTHVEMLPTDGLGHHRLLGDAHVIHCVVRHVAQGDLHLPL
jgi:pimeloyl-ACP methyl ester carboxylesterase